ncbi:alpha/beta hydrolase family protein [Bizionia myxarmorum]|uniref:Alpha/beta hydrolase fold domain-containing protein n=1 Tax=Bizionia myxarmorum TaxID=291186 RepID=A0A5D0RCN9_9FLAO|nr:alpha/beta hydrolase fold domain-containing protein [Bizionia myxarmorum]TYB78651.1 alpha/beta hydrolase fold domain-containing protein [Bizionia myxarmorum]
MRNKNLVLNRIQKKPIVWDAFFNKNSEHKPLVVFCHGYKGFKDWGPWNLVAEEFKKANLFFVKFNFSHNGGTVENPIDFPDLEAFAENNYSKELNDLDAILNYLLSQENEFLKEIDTNNITLIGHSRGGGISIIKASTDTRIKKIITWASVCDFSKRTATIGDLHKWKKDGVKYVLNGRTKQQMPHNYQFYEDFKAHENQLNIKLASESIKVPQLIIHTSNDPSVDFNEAETLHTWNNKSHLIKIEDSNHVFDGKHPWNDSELPKALETVVLESIFFIKSA